VRPAPTLKGCIRWSERSGRRRPESNLCTELCRPYAFIRLLPREIPARGGYGSGCYEALDTGPVVAEHRGRRVCWAILAIVSGRTYAENRPYLLPETLGELAGPLSGAVRLPVRLDWSERAEFHLDVPAERNVMYERVIREATRVEDLREYLNGAVLPEVWRSLFLPARVRRIWEDRFPSLRLAA
jgi:hypothetical protein